VEELDDFLKHAWGNGEVLVRPRDMFNNGNFDRREVCITKTAPLRFRPR